MLIGSTDYTTLVQCRSDSACVLRHSNETKQSRSNQVKKTTVGNPHHPNILVPQQQVYRTEPPIRIICMDSWNRIQVSSVQSCNATTYWAKSAHYWTKSAHWTVTKIFPMVRHLLNCYKDVSDGWGTFLNVTKIFQLVRFLPKCYKDCFFFLSLPLSMFMFPLSFSLIPHPLSVSPIFSPRFSLFHFSVTPSI